VFFDDLSREQTIRAFIKEGKSDQAAIVINNLKTLKAIKSIKFYSKEDAFKYLKEQIKNLGEIEKIPKQLFPEFIEISLNQEYNNIEYIKEFQQSLNKYGIFSATSFGEKWLINFLTIKFGLQLFLFIISILISICITSIIYSTIKINLAKYKKVFDVYLLVGASRAFVIFPFVVCTIFETIISFFIAYFTASIIFTLLNKKILESLSINVLIFPPIIMFVILFLIVILISTLSCFYSLFIFLNKESKDND
jgi:cell division transport system permease protein